MADTLKKLCSGTLSTTAGTLYTASTSVQAIVKCISLCNKSTSAATASVLFDGVNIICGHSIAANDSLSIPVTHIVEPSKLITGLAGTSSVVDYYFSGIEVL